MSRVFLRGVGRFGLMPDLLPSDAPPESWSDMRNMRMANRYAERIIGEVDIGGTLLAAPRNVFPAASLGNAFWIYAGLAKVSVMLPGTTPVHYDITRVSGDYTGGLQDNWNGVWQGGIFVLNNGVDVPQVWAPMSTDTPLIDLPYWPANTTVKVLRSYKNFLLGLEVTENGTRYPTKVMWSHPAEPGNYPPSWDAESPSYIAGNVSLSSSPGDVVDCLVQGDANIIYKTDSVVVQQFVETDDIFTWRDLSIETGAMAQQCIAEFKPRLHALFTQEGDFVVNDGLNLDSVLEKKALNFIGRMLSSNYRTNSFLVTDPRKNEVWVCFPEEGSDICTLALIWNWKDGTYSFRDIAPTYDIKRGLYTATRAPTTWGDQTQSWDQMSISWSQAALTKSVFAHHLIGAAYESSSLRHFNNTAETGTTTFESYLTRSGLSIYGTDGNGNPVSDPNVVKVLTEVWPEIEATPGTVISISVGYSNREEQEVTWVETKTFIVGTDQKIDCLVEGVYLAVRFMCGEQVPWKLYSYGLEISPVGMVLG